MLRVRIPLLTDPKDGTGGGLVALMSKDAIVTVAMFLSYGMPRYCPVRSKLAEIVPLMSNRDSGLFATAAAMAVARNFPPSIELFGSCRLKLTVPVIPPWT